MQGSKIQKDDLGKRRESIPEWNTEPELRKAWFLEKGYVGNFILKYSLDPYLFLNPLKLGASRFDQGCFSNLKLGASGF